MNRFFAIDKQDNFLFFDDKAQKHFKVLRLEQKEFVGVFENNFYLCRYENGKGVILDSIDQNHELPYQIILAAAIIKLDRFEWLLEKATELGVDQIVPIWSENTDSELAKFKFDRKRVRFEEILLNSAQQSFRNKVPTLMQINKYSDFLKTQADLKIIAHEKNDDLNLNLTKLAKNQKIIVLVGPEGGFSESEVEKAHENGYHVVSLGSRILRAETASIYLLAQLGENHGER
ncbi:16S rRNA (uracil(1498)-N(3))-methyltransferase [Mycoplasmopsis pullorum]|uniref:16S rRNA (uracil(1498)-N(3))-methyltransferase n=2 Tax=Mycoplasmopsis pullorum TaxID=48003 RepID=UPI00111AA77E|nr:16S rRNA (uracil(1498)-N(3))-methyltransferase [Mycoplasmopsis pullorum]TNK81783.1 16S rRNA (uracil(1498)-N(3))-methyltransferase [Mycoplasmopsis pullorum]TNK82400.1 16S rRNA (uracil(1498)-N(3))-methyltransferase [Mycoplasmopsis pullorum]TNK84659.1 16S rRNA (uracil(1498)-N(3))-methyltransferase [Mycoplasmopsis pullorum]TNK85481.1 16S rRNA (uracil(1498)-N(3))-methyltransferase [Mycoplasmopsis pullorum]TNK86966.1 16S rRNA (uracil(1498)-N(3))-methyltransferase [Mycoplasmopsis pullorum]